MAYRTAAAQWGGARADRQDARPICQGEPVDLRWAPDGRHIALLHSNRAGRLWAVENPLWLQRGGSGIECP